MRSVAVALVPEALPISAVFSHGLVGHFFKSELPFAQFSPKAPAVYDLIRMLLRVATSFQAFHDCTSALH